MRNDPKQTLSEEGKMLNIIFLAKRKKRSLILALLSRQRT